MAGQFQVGDRVEVQVHKLSGSWSPANIAGIDFEARTADVEFQKDNCVSDVPFAAMIVALTPDNRPSPWNTIATEVVQLVESFIKHKDQTAQSPNECDQVRRWVRHGKFDEHPIHRLYTTRLKLYEKFVAAHPDVKIGYATFKRLIPWYVRTGKRDTCLCGVCENMRLVLKSFNDLKAIFLK